MPAPAAPPSFLAAQAAQQAGDWAAAARGYRETLAAHPDALPAYHNLATALTNLLRHDEAEAVLRAGLARWPDDHRFRLNLGFLRLAVGDFAEGWPFYESRRWAEEAPVATPRLSFPEWRGEPVSSLLLFPEQGFGDQIQFARYVPLLKARGIAVTLACAPALARLFAPLGVPILPAEGQVVFPPCDAWALIGSLPLRLGTRPETIPSPAPLLARPRPAGGRVGLAWRGKPRPDPNRSLPPALAERILARPEVISLQPEDTGARDFQETAEIMAGLDLIISIDTAMAHLAGSLGQPTWLLLPALKTDWRWMRDRTDSLWYPSMRILREPGPGRWAEVVDLVLAELADVTRPAAPAGSGGPS